MTKTIFRGGAVCALMVAWMPASAQDADALAEMARKAQDPLADVKALMTDNTIAFDGGEDENDTNYGFQLQPVYSIPNESDYNLILRGIVPIVGVEKNNVLPPLGPEPRDDDKWGLSDSFVQLFISPKSEGAWKFGIGPQVSLKTQTSDQTAGPGWGAGLAGVVFGGVGNWSLGMLAMQHWGEEKDFDVLTLQPIITFNLEAIPGAYVGFNNAITYHSEARSGDAWTVPLGLTAGRTLLLGNGNGLDLSVGIYDLVERPDNAPKWQFKFGISLFFN